MAWGGAKAREIALAIADAQRATFRCRDCSWRYSGNVKAGRKLFKQHREHKHRAAA